jgi:hypothetical protein
MAPMAMDEFLRYLGTASVQKNISMVELGRRHRWSEQKKRGNSTGQK